MRTQSTLSGLCAATLLLVGCGREEPRPAPPVPTKQSMAPAVPRTSLSAANYVTIAGQIDLFEIRSAELALQRSNNRSVRDFASMMIQAHNGTSSQLSLAGRRLNLLPSRTLSPKYESMMEQLRSAPDFDTSYKRQQLDVHQEALSIHSSYAANGSSPTLRPVAAAAVPVIQRHLRMLRYI